MTGWNRTDAAHGKAGAGNGSGPPRSSRCSSRGSSSGDLSTSRHAAQATVAYSKLKIFGDVLSIIQSSYVEEVNMDNLVKGAINGMVQTLDPHSSYLTPEMLKQVEVETKGVFGGLGIEIGMKDGVLTIIAPIEDTPAARAGLRSGDRIVRIEKESTKNMNVMDAVKRLRGEPGTKVTITISRESLPEPKVYTLTRELIKIKSVKSKPMPDGIGYIRLDPVPAGFPPGGRTGAAGVPEVQGAG